MNKELEKLDNDIMSKKLWTCDLDTIRYESIVQGKSFNGCKINKKDFSNKKIKHCTFNKAKITDVKSNGASFDGVEFKNSFFTKVNLSDVVLQECDFEGAVLKSVDFTGSSCIDVKMDNMFLTDVDLTDVRFVKKKGTIFSVFKNVNIKDSYFVDVEIIGSTLFYDSDVYNTDFTDSNLAISDIQESRFYGCDFEDSYFEDSSFYDVKFTDSKFINADFESVNIKKSVFTRCDFTGTNFSNAVLNGVDFTGCDLVEAKFTNVSLDGVDFTGADLTNADFTGAVWKNTVFPDVKNYPTFKRISHKQTALIKEGEIIKESVDMMKFLNENSNSVAFFFQGNYHLIDKNELSDKIQTNSETAKKNNSIVYECKRIVVKTMEPENFVIHKPLMKFGSIYIDIEYIKWVIANKGEDRIYEIVETADKVKSVISYQVLHKLTDNVYSSHCQEGHGGKIYKLQKIQKMQTSKKITFLNSQKAGKKQDIRNKTSRRKTKKIAPKPIHTKPSGSKKKSRSNKIETYLNK